MILSLRISEHLCHQWLKENLPRIHEQKRIRFYRPKLVNICASVAKKELPQMHR
jgi:hypothetical protein